MNALADGLADLIGARPKPEPGASGGLKKNYTEALSHEISRLLAATLNDLGLTAARAPANQHDKTFMGGYGPKGCRCLLVR